MRLLLDDYLLLSGTLPQIVGVVLGYDKSGSLIAVSRHSLRGARMAAFGLQRSTWNPARKAFLPFSVWGLRVVEPR
ncbi:MAG: hypothetical protein ABJ327_05910 [Litoreibacter sp.]